MDLKIHQGDIFGIAGPNGSGKTTFLMLLATLLRPSSGTASILGYDLCKKPYKIRSLIGYVPESFGIYDNLTVYEYLSFFASAYKIPKENRKKVVNDIIELMELENSYLRKLSCGMLKRVSIARAIIHDPMLLILDEPITGLDPKLRFEVKEILKELSNMGKTIIISSSILTDLADICTRIGFFNKGRLLFESDKNTMLSADNNGIVIEILVGKGIENAKDTLEHQSDIDSIDIKGNMIKVLYKGEINKISNIVSELINNDIEVFSFKESSLELEDIYLKFMGQF
ncbi:MAG: ABC transporter ATP-binding protein [bacterium]